MTRAKEEVALRIEHELAAFASRAVESLQAEIPAYRGLHGPQLQDVEAIAYWSFRRLLQRWIAGSEKLDPADRARFRAIGAARAADGRPLTDVLRAYRLASTVFVRHVVDEYLDDLEPVDIADLSIAALSGIDAISEDIIDAYTAARERLTTDRGQARSALLDDLLAGRQNSPGALADRSRELALDLPTHPSLLVVHASDPQNRVDAGTLEDLLAHLGLDTSTSNSGRHLSTRRGIRAIILLPGSTPAAIIEKVVLAQGLKGCLIENRPIADAVVSYRLASDALDTAPAHAFDNRALLDEGDSQLLALLTAKPSAATGAVVSTVLGPLDDPGNEHILAGLAAFISMGTATDAAAALHVHPQTLRYRLRRARELTGRDPRKAWHRLALDTAIQLRQLQHPD
ncbi:MAG: helix-turn-helix domain-containing protein [Rhodococcus sp. (in: high G+C Gram-positive bacteria)]